ncbi:MAG: RluA family pseudouridine synthase [Akkermansiaceae bacterium]|jgi:tRNA pseudouridine32 synthase/23S rRNA pseudouridine746 synthase/23S rRNA pseudouridine1911/1915/1917 synthase
MHKRPKNFKPTPKRFHPASLPIVHEDHDILVVEKPSGLLTVSSDRERDRTAYAYLMEYVRKGQAKSRSRVFIVHRLDRETSGVLVFAKSEESKIWLQQEWAQFQKTYYAVVRGHLPEKEGVLTSYLAEAGVHKMVSVKDSQHGKLAKTAYKVVKETKAFSLLEIDLMSGKKHQIRVQLADQGCPIVGDKKYGVGEKGTKRLMLHAGSLTIKHPYTEEWMTFKTDMPDYFDALLKGPKQSS